MVKARSIELATNWLNAGRHDLDWAKGSFDIQKFAGVCFLSQQIVEKSLKAFLYSKNEELRKIHDLDALLSLAIKHDKSFSKFKKVTATLSTYYLKTRYPDIGDISIFDKEDLAKEALNWAEEIFNFVKEKLNVKI